MRRRSASLATRSCPQYQAIHLGTWPTIARLLGPPDVVPIKLDVERTIIDARCTLYYGTDWPRRFLSHEETRLLRRLLTWHDREGLYRFSDGASPSVNELGPKGAADWKHFWGEPDASILDGSIRFQGGDLPGKLNLAPRSTQDRRLPLAPRQRRLPRRTGR